MKIKNLFTLAAALMLTSLTAGAQLTINGLTTVYDSNTETYLCSIDPADFGGDYTATIRSTSTTWTNVAIEGTAVTLGTKYTFSQVEAGKTYLLTATVGGTAITAKISFTFLPIIQAKGNFSTSYTTGTLRVIQPDESGDSDLKAKIKWRGTATEEGQKHNYQIKFIKSDGTKKNRQFFNLRNDNSWLLNAGRKDLSRVRNRVLTDLWLDMASEPYYVAKDSTAQLGVGGLMVEFFVGNDYQGIYSFTEKMDRKQMGLSNYDETTLKINGVVFKADETTDQTLMIAGATFDNNVESQHGFSVKYPDVEDVLPTDFSVLSNAIDFVANSSDETFIAEVGNYFDLPVVADYIILLQSMMAVDNDGKNVYWGCYNINTDKKLTLGVWDLDSSVGQSKDVTDPHSSDVSATATLTLTNRLFARLKSLNPDGFYDNLIERYKALRTGLLDADAITARFTTTITALQQSGAAARETVRWSGHDDIGGATLDFANELEYISQWIPARLAFLDKTIDGSVEGDINGDKIVDVTDVNLMINMILGLQEYALEADLSTDNSIDVSDLNLLLNIMLTN